MNCYHCGSERTRKHGKTGNGKQRYHCRECGRSFREQPEGLGYTDAAKAQILRAYQKRASLRGLTRIFGVSRNTVSKWLKKSPDFASSRGHPGTGLGSVNTIYDRMSAWKFQKHNSKSSNLCCQYNEATSLFTIIRY